MSRRICPQCQRPETVCFCHTVQNINNHWPVHILQHPNEQQHAIGTARIAKLSLSHCTLDVAENASQSEITQSLLSKHNPVLVYPSDTPISAEELNMHSPRPLIFLDGTWRKTHRMLHESPELAKLPRISTPANDHSHYPIRKAPKAGTYSTIEAVAYILSALENNAEKFQPLLNTMDWMINKQIELMGEDTFLRNYKAHQQ